MTEAVAEKSTLVVPDAPYSQRGGAVAAPGAQPANLMQALAVAAADPRMDVAKVKELYAIHKEMVEREAAQAFADALARAQAKIEPIANNARNDHTKSSYAKLWAINEAVVPVYTAEGLAVSFDTYSTERDKDLPPLKDGWVRVIAIVSHRGGHSRRYHLDGPLDDAGKDGTKNKTGIQAMGSTVSYLRRYLVNMIFNAATFDDNDGNGGGSSGERVDEKTIADFLAKMDEAGSVPDLMKVFAEAYNAAENVKDKSAQRRYLEHRDARKKVLQPQGRRP
ncbi:MAG TPA: ERF family protein [Usitatibacter sp.]|nr:ERF family protein [Usitatibacter sp.]